MCGIAGIFNYRDREPVNRALLDEMTDLIAHRGPDGRDVYVDGPLGLGHRRLAIVDLSDAGKQPMATADGRVVITYNGETYNHATFRPELEAGGVRFRGHADTETIIYLFAKHGVDAFAQLAGIFCFAIWDQRDQALYIVRDPVGVKQVYYWTDGSRLAFASEAKALLLHPGVKREPDYEAIGEYVHFHSTAGDRTFFRDIKLLPAGHYLRVDRNGITRARYVPADDYTPLGLSESETTDLLQRSIASVVDSQLMSDVPVGCFVSGGIDSSVVAKYSRDFIAAGRLSGFGCYYQGENVVNEEPYAREVAKALDVSLRATYPTVDDFTSLFERALWHQDEPKIGAAMISMWKVAELAASEVTVCLGGQAADEMFGGYPRYATAAPFRILSQQVRNSYKQRRKGIAPTVQKQLSKGNNVQRLLRLMNPLHGWRRRYFDAVAQIPDATLRSFINDPTVVDRKRYYATYNAIVDQCPSKDPIDRVMYFDRVVYLPGLFVQDDRMSMAHSLETRVPLADPRLVRLALRIPNRWKLNGLASKYILKQALHGVIPEWVINRQKAGFETPAKLWFAGEGRDMTRDLLAGARAKERGLYQTANTGALLNGMGAGSEVMIWKLINIEQWFRIFIDQSPAQWQYARRPAAQHA